MNEKVSIIVPVYNAEKYLSQCIESILNLDYKNFELLLVNDGSNDTSDNICDNYATRDKRITVFHKKNGGVSSARNIGLENANGTWIAFIDSDDWVKSDHLCPINEVNDSIDIIHVGFTKEFPTGRQQSYYPETIGIVSMDDSFSNQNFMSQSVSYFFKKNIIDHLNIRFSEEIDYSEDREFIAKCLLSSKNIFQAKCASYFYRANPLSAIYKKRNYNRCLDDLVVIENIHNFTQDNQILWNSASSSFFYTELLHSYLLTLAINRPKHAGANIKSDMKRILLLLSDVPFESNDYYLFLLVTKFPSIAIAYKRLRVFISYIYRTHILKEQ